MQKGLVLLLWNNCRARVPGRTSDLPSNSTIKLIASASNTACSNAPQRRDNKLWFHWFHFLDRGTPSLGGIRFTPLSHCRLPWWCSLTWNDVAQPLVHFARRTFGVAAVVRTCAGGKRVGNWDKPQPHWMRLHAQSHSFSNVMNLSLHQEHEAWQC